MLTILGAVLAITLVIFVHEMGHFVTAKRLGVIVEEFGFGFPPRLLRLWRDRATVYVRGEKVSYHVSSTKNGAAKIYAAYLEFDRQWETLKRD